MKIRTLKKVLAESKQACDVVGTKKAARALERVIEAKAAAVPKALQGAPFKNPKELSAYILKQVKKGGIDFKGQPEEMAQRAARDMLSYDKLNPGSNIGGHVEGVVLYAFLWWIETGRISTEDLKTLKKMSPKQLADMWAKAAFATTTIDSAKNFFAQEVSKIKTEMVEASDADAAFFAEITKKATELFRKAGIPEDTLRVLHALQSVKPSDRTWSYLDVVGRLWRKLPAKKRSKHAIEFEGLRTALVNKGV